MIKNLKSLRQSSKISQQQFADIISVSQQSVNKYENHDVEPDTKTLIRIADYFNVSLDYLVGRTQMKERADALHMSDLSKSEIQLVETFRRLKENQKSCIAALINSIE